MLTHLYIYIKKDISLDKKAFFKYSTPHQELFLYKKKIEMYEVAGDQYKRQFYSYFANTL